MLEAADKPLRLKSASCGLTSTLKTQIPSYRRFRHAESEFEVQSRLAPQEKPGNRKSSSTSTDFLLHISTGWLLSSFQQQIDVSNIFKLRSYSSGTKLNRSGSNFPAYYGYLFRLCSSSGELNRAASVFSGNCL